MKNKKGFTLIELLATIVIMMMLLALAIVGFISTKKAKQKEMWEGVKGQIETSAEEYFYTNEYLFEGLQEGAIAYIPIGKLVADDYLNEVVDPRDKKPLSYCHLVTVKRKNGKLKASYNEEKNDDKCYSKNQITIKDPGKLKADLYWYYGGVKRSYDGGWLNSSQGHRDPHIIIDANSEVGIANISVVDKYITDDTDIINERKYNTTNVKYDITSETSRGSINVLVVDKLNRKAKIVTDYKRDVMPPEGLMDIYSSSGSEYNSKNVNAYLDFRDTISKVSKVTIGSNNYTNTNFTKQDLKPEYEWRLVAMDQPISSDYDGITHKLRATLYDYAGNSTTIESSPYTVYKKCSDKTTTTTWGEYSDCTASCGGGTKTRYGIEKGVDNKLKIDCGSITVPDTVGCNTQGCCSKIGTTTTETASIYKWNTTYFNKQCDKDNLINKYDVWVALGKYCKKGDEKKTVTSPDCPKNWDRVYPHSPYIEIQMGSSDAYYCNCEYSDYNKQLCKSSLGTARSIHSEIINNVTHHNAIIVYTKDKEGENACKASTKTAVLASYVRFVCAQSPNANGIINDHGWSFSKYNNNSILPTNTWLHNGSNKTEYSSDINKACELACKYKKP